MFTTDSPYAAVLEGLPTQLALALRRLGFAAPGNLTTFVDDYEGTETELEQAVSEADTTTTVIGVGAVSGYTSGDPKRRRLGKSSPLSPTISSPLLPSFSPSSGVIAVVASIEDKRSEYGACSPLASKAVEGTCTAASSDTETPHEAWSQDKEGQERIGPASKVLESRGVVGAGCGKSEHVEMAEILENRGVGVASRGEDEVDGRRGTEIQVSGSTAPFLGGSSPHSEKTSSFPAVSTTSKSSKTCSQVRGAEWADSAHASSQVICLSSPPAYAHSSSQSPSEEPAPTPKLWSMRRCCRKGSSHSSGISEQQRGQPASELRGSGQGRRRCK